MILRTKLLEMEARGNPVVVLTREDAAEAGILAGENVRILVKGTYILARALISDSLVNRGEIGFPRDTSRIEEGLEVDVLPAETPRSIDYIRKKMRGELLSKEEIRGIVEDMVEGNLDEAGIAAYVTAIYTVGMTLDEIEHLTRSMVETGDVLDIRKKPLFDSHSIGGVPGNKYALVMVPIVAAAGLTIPKTSSRAITSAAGTADVMEVLAPVDLTAEEISEIASRVGGTIAWGGALNLAPADDIIIRVEKRLGVDPRPQLLASIMAKKAAARIDDLVIDIPVGPGTKVERIDTARSLARDFVSLAERLDIRVECAITYGGQPIGYAIGPALEAREALRTLMGNGPGSLIEKACELAGILLEMGGVADRGEGKRVAEDILRSGRAYQKMREIIEAQGGDPDIKPEDIPIGEKRYDIVAPAEGYLKKLDNKALTLIARAAGAPSDKGAGILLRAKEGKKLEEGEKIMTIFAERERKLREAVMLAKRLRPFEIETMVLERYGMELERE